MKVAIVHYWLLGMRGGEKVIESLCDIFPDADIFTHVYDPKKISSNINRHAIQTSFIQSLPFASRLYKQYLPLMPSALEGLDLTDYDLVISSESGPAKGVIVRPDALHICYCHSPMRYLWDQYHQYYAGAGFFSKAGMVAMSGRLRQWDFASAARVDHFIANSEAVAMRISKYWRRTAEVIPPPVDTKKFKARGDRDDFYLHVGEFVPYKRADIAIKACSMLDKRLIVIGDGPGIKSLKAQAGPTVEFLGKVPDEVLADHYAKCRALLFPAEEDFGIVPVEAMSAGAPVIAFYRGGAQDYVVPEVTGQFFEKQTVQGMIEAIVRFEMKKPGFNHQEIARHARKFDRSIFEQRIKQMIVSKIGADDDRHGFSSQLQKDWNIQKPAHP
ncbi:MAG: glycosyltransferase, partial [Pseudomonadota bacterium]